MTARSTYDSRSRTRHGSQRRREVLDAGRRLFSSNGYHQTTIRDIADEVGAAKGIFYWYFSSKESFFTEILSDLLQALRASQQEALINVEGPEERLEAGIRASLRFFREQQEAVALLRSAAHQEEFSALLLKGQMTLVEDVAFHISEGIRGGAFRRDDPLLLAHGIFGTVLHFVETFLDTPDESMTAERLDDEIVAFCIKGLARG